MVWARPNNTQLSRQGPWGTELLLWAATVNKKCKPSHTVPESNFFGQAYLLPIIDHYISNRLKSNFWLNKWVLAGGLNWLTPGQAWGNARGGWHSHSPVEHFEKYFWLYGGLTGAGLRRTQLFRLTTHSYSWGGRLQEKKRFCHTSFLACTHRYIGALRKPYF